MKNPPSFPKFPKGLSTKEVRQEIQRRLEIMDQMGLIRKSKNSKAVRFISPAPITHLVLRTGALQLLP